jgi:hypothetical protein
MSPASALSRTLVAAIRAVPALALAALLVGCTAVQFGERYDKSIDDDLNAFQKTTAEFLKTMTQEAATAKGAYGSDVAKKYYATATATLSNLELRAQLLSGRECPVNQLAGAIEQSALTEIAAAEAKAGVTPVDAATPSGNCIKILITNVEVAERGLEADHREQGHLTPIANQLAGIEIDHAVSIALAALRSKKY